MGEPEKYKKLQNPKQNFNHHLNETIYPRLLLVEFSAHSPAIQFPSQIFSNQNLIKYLTCSKWKKNGKENQVENFKNRVNTQKLYTFFCTGSWYLFVYSLVCSGPIKHHTRFLFNDFNWFLFYTVNNGSFVKWVWKYTQCLIVAWFFSLNF
jgi:hypothetical protein